MHRVLMVMAYVAATATLLAQGTLTPSAPPGPTMKTLDQIEPRIPINSLPFTISAAGSYYLTTNLVYTGTGHGITINAGDVTLDLNGFALVGNNGASQSNGVHVATSVNNVAIRNGTLRLWKYGIYANTVYGGIYTDLRLSSCATNGLTVGGSSVIERCTAASLSGYGITTGGGSTIKDCATETCTAGGINAWTGSTIVHCSFAQNTGPAITTSSGCTVQECSVYNNNGIAITTLGNCLINGCTIANNFNVGISTSYSTVQNCTINANSGDGILAGSNTKIFNNNLYANGGSSGSNIHVTGSWCRVEGNHATQGPRGIKVDAASNVIIKNSAGGNSTNYTISANNLVGASISYSTTGTNTNPQANYDF